MERDILRRTHNIFSSIKDESINKYEDREMNVAFVDENTLKYQNMIKNMEQKKGNKNSGSSEDSDDNDDDKGELINQTTIITTSVKHVGKGIVIQSYDISDNDDDDGDGNKYDNKAIMDNRDMDHIGDKIVTKPNTSCNTNKKIVYESDNIINVDDI